MINEIQEKVTAIAKITRLNKLRVNVCTVRNLTLDLLIVKLQETVTLPRKILSDKNLFFNCAEAKNRTAECRSSKIYLKCKNKHHTSISAKLADSKSESMLATTETNVTYLVAIIKVNGVKCRALLDTG